jgi:hypothetical protein
MSGVAEYCQACQREPASSTVVNPKGAPFEVCPACATRIQSYALRPLEWYNLAVIHGPWAFHLHDDFYDARGKALQPKTKVPGAANLSAPTFAEKSATLDGLLEYC